MKYFKCGEYSKCDTIQAKEAQLKPQTQVRNYRRYEFLTCDITIFKRSSRVVPHTLESRTAATHHKSIQFSHSLWRSQQIYQAPRNAKQESLLDTNVDSVFMIIGVLYLSDRLHFNK